MDVHPAASVHDSPPAWRRARTTSCSLPGYAGWFQRLPFFALQNCLHQKGIFLSVRHSSQIPMLCVTFIPEVGRKPNRGLFIPLAHRPKNCPQNSLESFGVYTVVYRANPHSPVSLTLPLDHRAAAQHDYRWL